MTQVAANFRYNLVSQLLVKQGMISSMTVSGRVRTIGLMAAPSCARCYCAPDIGTNLAFFWRRAGAPGGQRSGGARSARRSQGNQLQRHAGKTGAGVRSALPRRVQCYSAAQGTGWRGEFADYFVPGDAPWSVRRIGLLYSALHCPSIADDAGGDALLQGSLDLGEGNYHVDWLMRDRLQRVCSSYWDMDAALPSKDRDMKLEMPPGAMESAHIEQFTEEPPIARVLDKTPLKIKVLVNFAPQNFGASTMRPQDTSALVAILRQLAREPQFGKYSVVAFNIQEQRVMYRQESEDTIDFPALGEALSTVKLGIVDASKLQRKHGDTEFLTDLIQHEMSGDDHPDALIFAGPKVMLDASVPEEALKPLTDVDYPIFYMNYALNPQAIPWRDSIGRAIRVFRGTEFTISRPRDMWFSVSDMISRIVKSSYTRLSIRSTQ